MNEQEIEKLDRLLDEYFDERMDEASREWLDRELGTSGEARQRFWQRAGLEESLESWGNRRRGETTALEEIKPRRQWAAVTGWAAAAMLTVAWLIQFRSTSADSGSDEHVPETVRPVMQTGTKTGYPVAYVSQLVGVKSKQQYRSGESVGAGEEIRIEEGLMELVLYSGARVTIQGPATLRPTSDLEVELSEGRAQADVPESAISFRMTLPDGVVTDFGTSFDVSVEGRRTSRVQVLEGEIELAAGDEQREVRRLTKGQAVRLADEGRLEDIDFAPMAVGRSLDDRSIQDARRRMEDWLEYCKRIDADESVVVHFSMLPEERGADVILNQSQVSKSPRSGTVISAAWSEGRWAGKPALAFRRPSDRVRVDIPGEYPNATLVTWVRVDALPRQYNGLFFSEYGIDGEVHWQFSSDGRYMFGVRPTGAPPVSKFHRAFSEPVLSPWLFGSWRMLTTTYDAASREVVHYVDAAEVSRTTLEESVPLHFGRATLGNFFDPYVEKHQRQEGMGAEWSFRNWTGAIDEFILFSRVLPSDEIRRLYADG